MKDNEFVRVENGIHIHESPSPGLTMDETTIEQLADGTWKAVAPIGSIFGAEVNGECRGVGVTKEEALEALKKDQDDLYQSLWV